MTRGKATTKPVTKAQVRLFMGKSEEYLAVAEFSLENGHTNAATSNATHAGINASDAILGARNGERPNGQDHMQAIPLLRAVPQVGADAANALTRLLSKKTQAEYDPDPVRSTDATSAVEQARRLVALARRVASDLLRPEEA